MRVALYARVSTSKQDAHPQLAKLHAWAKEQGHEVHLEVIDTVSGRHHDRPGLAQVMQAARARWIHAVAVVKVDRWGRSAGHANLLVHELNDHGVAFHAIDQGLKVDPKAKGMEGMASRLVLTVLQAMADFEADLISERTKDGLVSVRARLQAEGKNLGRPPKPCHDCHAERWNAGDVWGKRKGRRVPLCADCKARGSGKGVQDAQENDAPKSGGLGNGRIPSPGGGPA